MMKIKLLTIVLLFNQIIVASFTDNSDIIKSQITTNVTQEYATSSIHKESTIHLFSSIDNDVLNLWNHGEESYRFQTSQERQDNRNFRDDQRAYYGKVDQAYRELCKLNPSEEKIEEFRKRRNPIIDAALIKYQIEKLCVSLPTALNTHSTQDRHRDSSGWYTDKTF